MIVTDGARIVWFLRSARTYLLLACTALGASIATQLWWFIESTSGAVDLSTSAGAAALGFGYLAIVLLVFHAVVIWLPTLGILALLGLVGRRVSTGAFRWLAVAALPLPALWLGLGLVGEDAVFMLLFELPAPVVFAMMVRLPDTGQPLAAGGPPGVGGPTGAVPLAAGGLTVGEPSGAVPLAAGGLPVSGPSGAVPPAGPVRPAAYWHAVSVWALIWIGALIWSAEVFPLAATPPDDRRAAPSASAPRAEINQFFEPGHTYVVYRAGPRDWAHGGQCYLTNGGPARMADKVRMFSVPDATVVHQGVEYSYAGQITGGNGRDGTVECQGRNVLIEQDPPMGPSPWLLAALALLALPVAASAGVALARRRASATARATAAAAGSVASQP